MDFFIKTNKKQNKTKENKKQKQKQTKNKQTNKTKQKQTNKEKKQKQNFTNHKNYCMYIQYVQKKGLAHNIAQCLDYCVMVFHLIGNMKQDLNSNMKTGLD